MSRQAIELSYAIRFLTIGRYSGQLCLALALLASVPLVVSLMLRDTASSLRYAATVLLLGTAGFFLSRLQASPRIQTNEAMVIVTLIFLLMPLLMTYPMMASGLNFIDALFESVSACTTTGLSTLATVADKPPVFLFARAWMQWYGGLGFVVLSLAILVHPGLTAKTLAVTDEHEDDLAGGTRVHARRVLLSYGGLTLIGIIVLWLLGGNFFHAVLYTFSTVSTGGFSPHELSLTGYGSRTLQWTVTLLCLAASFSLTLYYNACRKDPRLLYEDPQLRALLLIASLVVGLLILSMALNGMAWSAVLHHGPLLALSAQTTAGFSTLDPGSLDSASKAILISSMAIGGGIGSTAGGFKILRLLILVRLLHVTIVRTCLPPHAVFDTYLGKRRLQEKEIQEALGIILLFIVVVLCSWLPFLAMGYDPLDALFEVVSATGTVGLSTGITGPDLPWFLKGILGADMLMGRLEIVAWIVLFYPRTWIGKRAEV
jgi:trk system potassium uptake protein TrkH